MEKLKILIAEDLLSCREDFIDYFNLYFSSNYDTDFHESESAQDAITKLIESSRKHDYFDIVVCDIDFSENQFNEDKNAGFEIIKKAKEINSQTQIIWYSAQKEEDPSRFKIEEEFIKKGLINHRLKKAYMNELFKETLENCINEVLKNRINLVVFFFKLFDSYNYGNDENIGFYKLTHSNYDHQKMLKYLDQTFNFFNNSIEKQYITEQSKLIIENYLNKIRYEYPSQEEMISFKSYFRLEFTEDILKSCQEPLFNKNVQVTNNINTTIPRIYCEKERILIGLKTIYENIARHNFQTLDQNNYVKTTVESINSKVILTIEANGNSFNPQEAFMHLTPGLSSIKKAFDKYCSVIYEGNGISYNIYNDITTNSNHLKDLKITLTFLLPKPKSSSGELLNV